MIQKLLKQFKERDGTHTMYSMPYSSLHIDIHYTRGIYLSITLHEGLNTFYTINYNSDTLEPISIDNETRFSKSKIVEVADIDAEKFNLYNSKIINFIKNYDPEYQIAICNDDIERYTKQINESIESYKRAINSVEENIALYRKGLP